jgi:iron complex outermembrane receptor protein
MLYRKIRPALIFGAPVLLAAPAFAQAADEAPALSATQAQPASGPGTAPQLEDIVVTAQRREQSLQRVPISVDAFDSQALKALSAESLGDLDNFTPGLDVNDTSVTQPSYSIRGVSTDDFGIGTEPSIGIFVDGVYSARSGASLVFFNDIQRVEVLKGPQGTLFGRNTSAGAISIVTNKPADKVEAFGTVQLGNYGKVRADVTGNVPLTSNLFLRVDGVFDRRNGYLHDAVTHEDREREHDISGRVALRWEPSASTTFDLSYDHDDTDKDGPASVGISVYALSTDPHGPFTNDVMDNKETRNLDGLTLTGRHDFGAVELTSITAYKTFVTHNREDEDGTGDATRYLDTENIEHNNSFYQELRLSHDDTRFHILGGISYFHENARQTSAVTLLTDSVNRLLGDAVGFPIFTILDGVGLPVFGIPFEEDMNNHARNNSYAAYADATYDVTPKLSLTAGIRYTHDDKRFTWENGNFISPGIDAVTAPGALYNAILGADLFPAASPVSVGDFFRATVGPDGLVYDEGALEGVPFTRRAKFNDVSPRFVVQYKIEPDLMVYASATRGYKAGGFDSQSINSYFAPENVWNFETGFKSELFDHRLRVNASGYYFKYRNRQSISLEQTDPRCNQNPAPAGTICVPEYITSSGDSEAFGVDFDTQFVVSRDLTLSATAGAINSRWVKRVEQGVDISGQPTGEPRFRGILGAHYDHQLPSASSVFGDVSYSYTSRIPLNNADRAINASIAPYVDLDKLRDLYTPRNIINARVGWRSPGDHFSASLYVENLLNERKPRTLNTITADTFHTPYVRIDRPRFFGVELGYWY